MERQSLLKEFGDGQNLQYLIDNTEERFAPVLWGNFFSWKDVSTITYETVIGDYANAAAASVVSYDSAAPLRTRRAIRKLVGEIPSIREKFRMGEKDLQEYLAMSRAGAGAQAILRLIFDDVKQAAESPHRRLDIFALEALSTGEITLDTTTNPDGIVTESAIDFGMPAANKVICQGAVWQKPPGSPLIASLCEGQHSTISVRQTKLSTTFRTGKLQGRKQKLIFAWIW
jgi:hypothetical protein